MVKKRKAPHFNDISDRTLFDTMNQAYSNAEDYYYEAELLYRLRSYGHSLSLSALGLEELGKSYAFMFLLFEKLSPGFLGKTESLKPDDLLETIHRSHDKKQNLSLGFSWMSHISFRDFLEMLSKIDTMKPERLTLEWIVKTSKELRRKTLSRLKHSKRWQREHDFLKKVQTLKEEGMYVGIHKESIEFYSPKKMKSKDAKKCLNMLDKYIDLGDFIPNIIWEENAAEIIRE